jgi:hypothetical protein
MFRMRGLPLQALPVRLQGSKQGAVIRFLDAGLYQNHEIQALERLLMPAEAFPCQPFDAISVNRPTDMLLGYGKTQSGCFPTAFIPCKHGKIPI